jgi:hypothetical protein
LIQTLTLNPPGEPPVGIAFALFVGNGLEIWGQIAKEVMVMRKSTQPGDCTRVLEECLEIPRICRCNYECRNCAFDQWLDATEFVPEHSEEIPDTAGYRRIAA